MLQRVQTAARSQGDGVHVRGSGEHHGEFIAAQPSHGVARLELIAQPNGYLLEQHVAEVMAERVVHFLEAIEIHQQQCGQRLLRARGLQRFLQPLEEQHAIRQIGQHIVQRLMPQRHDLILAVGDVSQECDPVRQLTAVLDRNDLQLQLELRSILSLGRHLGFEGVAIEDVIEHGLED